MEILEYGNAQRLGKKQYQDDLAREVSPYLPVLDEILENADAKPLPVILCHY